MIVGAVVAALVMMSVAVLLLLGNSTEAKKQRETQAATLRVLVECTTPPALRNPPEKHVKPDDCFVRQQAATADFAAANGPLSPLLGAAAACGAAHPGDIPATRACVLKGLR